MTLYFTKRLALKAGDIETARYLFKLTLRFFINLAHCFIESGYKHIMGEAQMVQEFPPAFYRVLEEQKTWQK